MALGIVFFFQAEDGIRDKLVTGVQTCALPIWRKLHRARAGSKRGFPTTRLRSAGSRRNRAPPERRRTPGVLMTEIWALAALWLGLALLAALLSIWLKVANALSEILVGTARRPVP